MADCPFCKIIAGDLSAARLVETDKVLSFMDINPVNPGHALVIPKRHVECLLDLTQEELHAISFLVRRVAGAVVDATDADGFNVLQNNGECAGQVVPHVHFHVIPRNEDDEFTFGWRQTSYEEGRLEELTESIRENL